MRHLARWSLCITLFLMMRSWLLEQAHWLVDHGPQTPDAAVLLRAVGALLGAPALLSFALFSRIDESRALENASRQRLRDAIRAEPGLGLSELRGRAGLGWGTTVYHLNRMESTGLVRSRDVGRRRAFFLPEQEREMRDAAAGVANGAQLRLLAAVRAHPGASQKQLAADAALGLPLANRYLQRFEEAGLVRSTKEWRVRTYEPTQRLIERWDELAQRRMSTTPSLPLSVPPSLSPRGTNAP